MSESAFVTLPNPKRMQEENVHIVCIDATHLPEVYIEQIVDKSRQPHIQATAGHSDLGNLDNPGRFHDRDSFKKWADQQRTLYLIVAEPRHDAPYDIGGILWFGRKSHPLIPHRYTWTFGIRHYAEDTKQGWGHYLGKGFGQPFITAAHLDMLKRYPGMSVWIDIARDNDRAHVLYERCGYENYMEWEEPTLNAPRLLMTWDPTPPQVYIDFDNTLYDTNRFADALWELVASKSNRSLDEVRADRGKFTRDPVLGGYDYEAHISAYGLDAEEMWQELDTLIKSNDFLIQGASEFIGQLRFAGFKPVIFSFGLERFQNAKIEPNIEALSRLHPDKPLPFVITMEPKRTYIAEHQTLTGGVLVDDVPGQDLPDGYVEITIDHSKDHLKPIKHSDNHYQVSNFQQAFSVIHNVLPKQNELD